MDILTTAAQSYIDTFNGYMNQFLQWGQWLFLSLLVLNLVWMSLWLAFDRHALSETMPSFIKKFAGITIFYTIMMNASWLVSVLRTMESMGSTLTHQGIDPSSIISMGIGIGNKLLIPVMKSSLLSMGFGVIIVSLVYVVTLYVFIRVALELAETLILTTALIAMASFFLGFAALGATTQIARQTLDVILANCVKLLGLYIVVAAGSHTMLAVSNAIPQKILSFDPYAWLVAVAFLFLMLSKSLPSQMAKIVSGAIQESRGADPAALAMAAIQYAQMANPALKMAAHGVGESAKIAGGMAYNAAAHFNEASANTGSHLAGLKSGALGSMTNLGKAVAGNVSDHFKNLAHKAVGGSDSQPVDRVSERLYQFAQEKNATTAQGMQAGADSHTPTHSSDTISRPKPS